MSKLMSIIFLNLFITTILVNAQPAINDTAQDFTVIDISGKTHNLYDYLNDGKFVCIDFFGVECEACIELVAVFDSIYFDYGCNQNDIILLGINYHDSNQDVIDNQINHGGHYPVVSGLEGGGFAVYTDWVVEYYPQFVVIHPDKTLVANVYPITREGIDIAFNYYEIQEANCTTNNIVDAHKLQDDLIVYPNPANDKIEFNISDIKLDNEQEFYISDIYGREIICGKCRESETINLMGLENGIYFLNINYSNKIYRQKFIKT